MMYRVFSARIAGLAVFGSMVALGSCSMSDESGVPAATVITPDGADHWQSVLSLDGARLAFLVNRGAEGYDLWVADGNGANGRLLTSIGDLGNPPVWSPDGRQIAFLSNRASLADVWIVSLDGGEPRQLTDGPGLEVPFSFHPDGEQLVYTATTAGGEVNCYVLSMNDGHVRPLIEDMSACGTFSPDGSKLVFASLGSNTIWVADADGTNARQLTTEGFEFLANPPWSPDGSEILYVSRRTGAGDVWAVPADGGEPRQITRDVRDDNAPSWSSDGQWITFVSERGRQTDVWVIPAAGGEAVRVTDDVQQEAGPQFRAGTHTVNFQRIESVSALWVRSMGDGAERQLTPDDQRIAAPDISPDGSTVLYRVLRGGGVSDLWVLPVNGGEPRALTSGSGNNFDGQWAPDGSAIGFVSDRAGSNDVWVMDPDGQNPRRLTEFPENESSIEWSADSRLLYFVSEHESTGFADLWSVAVADGEVQQVTSIGTVGDVETSRTSPTVFVGHLGGEAGQIALSMLAENGKDLVTVYDRTSVLAFSHLAIAPSGDRIVALLELEGGALGSAIVTTSGEMQRILGEREFGAAWSPDGERLIYFTPGLGGQRQGDLAVYAFADGSTVRLTETPEAESSPRWTPDGEQVVFVRGDNFQRIVQVDMSDAIEEASAGGR